MGWLWFLIVGALAGWLASARISVYHSTPTLYRHLFAAPPPEARFPGVRLMVLEGENAGIGDIEMGPRDKAVVPLR